MTKQTERFLYLLTTPDELELPVAVADSGAELAKMTGHTVGTIYSYISRRQHCYKIPVHGEERGERWENIMN